MSKYLQEILSAQFEAVLFMLHECIEKCPPAQWDDLIGKYSFWQAAYHTLCFADCYLSPSDDEFVTNEFHPAGRKELELEYPSRRFTKDELLKYLAFCRNKARKTIPAETTESLAGPSGFPWYKITRGEMHLINLRHIQHHTGQLSAHLRRTNESLQDPKALRWSGSGWRV